MQTMIVLINWHTLGEVPMSVLFKISNAYLTVIFPNCQWSVNIAVHSEKVKKRIESYLSTNPNLVLKWVISWYPVAPLASTRWWLSDRRTEAPSKSNQWSQNKLSRILCLKTKLEAGTAKPSPESRYRRDKRLVIIRVLLDWFMQK